MSGEEWVKLAAVDECPPGRAKFVAVGGRGVAIFHLLYPDRFVVTPNDCPHAGGNLSAGELDRNTITCPWHAWTFDLDTGYCPMAEQVRLALYPSRVMDGHIYAKLPEMPLSEADGAT